MAPHYTRLLWFLLWEFQYLVGHNVCYIHSFIAFSSHTSCNWILKHEYKRNIKLIQYIHIKYTTI